MITEISIENIKDINKANEPFLVVGKIIPRFENEVWTYTELLYNDAFLKSYPDDKTDFENYINNSEKTIYFFYDNDNCVGQIVLRRNWNGYAFIEDIAVKKDFRGNGIGNELIKKSIQWAKQNNLCGLMLETQDNNLLACRFYKKCGFKLGAVDTMLYSNFDNIDERALFWYLKF